MCLIRCFVCGDKLGFSTRRSLEYCHSSWSQSLRFCCVISPSVPSSSSSSSARHGDGLYDSYMRTDHILKDDADTNSPSGLPPVPKHTVSVPTNTHPCSHTHTHTHRSVSTHTNTQESRVDTVASARAQVELSQPSITPTLGHVTSID